MRKLLTAVGAAFLFCACSLGVHVKGVEQNPDSKSFAVYSRSNHYEDLDYAYNLEMALLANGAKVVRTSNATMKVEKTLQEGRAGQLGSPAEGRGEPGAASASGGQELGLDKVKGKEKYTLRDYREADYYVFGVDRIYGSYRLLDVKADRVVASRKTGKYYDDISQSVRESLRELGLPTRDYDCDDMFVRPADRLTDGRAPSFVVVPIFFRDDSGGRDASYARRVEETLLEAGLDVRPIDFARLVEVEIEGESTEGSFSGGTGKGWDRLDATKKKRKESYWVAADVPRADYRLETLYRHAHFHVCTIRIIDTRTGEVAGIIKTSIDPDYVEGQVERMIEAMGLKGAAQASSGPPSPAPGTPPASSEAPNSL